MISVRFPLYTALPDVPIKNIFPVALFSFDASTNVLSFSGSALVMNIEGTFEPFIIDISIGIETPIESSTLYLPSEIVAISFRLNVTVLLPVAIAKDLLPKSPVIVNCFPFPSAVASKFSLSSLRFVWPGSIM